jgi:uncharacterized membrane protein
MDTDGELKGLLLETLKISRENNKMLRAMRRDATIGRILSVVWFLIILIGPVVLYFYFLQPYIDQVLSTYESVGAQGGQLIDTSGIKSLLDLF